MLKANACRNSQLIILEVNYMQKLSIFKRLKNTIKCVIITRKTRIDNVVEKTRIDNVVEKIDKIAQSR